MSDLRVPEKTHVSQRSTSDDISKQINSAGVQFYESSLTRLA